MNEVTTEDYVQIACTILGILATILLLILCFPVAAVIIIYGMGKSTRQS